MTNKLKVCVIGIYFGKLPEHFPLWVKSVEANETIDFILFTDQSVDNAPGNLQVISSSLEDIKLLIEHKLDMEISLERPYKLCEYRPAYMQIFEDYVASYDYVGHCDFDMLLGDIRAFLEEYHIEEYDKFLPLGHLALYKNSDAVKGAYKLDGGECSYKEAFTTEKACYFDEFVINDIFRKNGLRLFDNADVLANINPDFSFMQLIDSRNHKKQMFYWEDGKVYRAFVDGVDVKTEEYIYIHLPRRKMHFEMETSQEIHGVVISSNAYLIKESRGVPQGDDIVKYNSYSAIKQFREGYEMQNSVKQAIRALI